MDWVKSEAWHLQWRLMGSANAIANIALASIFVSFLGVVKTEIRKARGVRTRLRTLLEHRFPGFLGLSQSTVETRCRWKCKCKCKYGVAFPDRREVISSPNPYCSACEIRSCIPRHVVLCKVGLHESAPGMEQTRPEPDAAGKAAGMLLSPAALRKFHTNIWRYPILLEQGWANFKRLVSSLASRARLPTHSHLISSQGI